MSQFTHPKVPAAIRSHKLLALSALIALAATAAVVLVIAIGGSTQTSAVSEPQVQPVSGPRESAVAAAVGSRPSPLPDESHIAASVAGSGSQVTDGPDEARIAQSLSGRR